MDDATRVVCPPGTSGKLVAGVRVELTIINLMRVASPPGLVPATYFPASRLLLLLASLDHLGRSLTQCCSGGKAVLLQ